MVLLPLKVSCSLYCSDRTKSNDNDSLRYNRSKPFFQSHSTLNSLYIFSKQEIISREIVDETDQFEDNHTKIVARRSANWSMMKGYAWSCFFTVSMSRMCFFIFRIVEHSPTREYGSSHTQRCRLSWDTCRADDSAIDLTLSKTASVDSRRFR